MTAAMSRVSRQDKLPLYQQLYEILRAEIVSGNWKVGDLIPTEPELIARYGVSRTTVRQVLDKLVNEGLIYRQRGRGSFVAEPTVEQGLVRITSFTEDMQQRGLEPGTRVLEAAIVPAPAEIAVRLHIEPGEELAHLRRLRLAGGEPMSMEDSFLIHRLAPGVLNRDFSTTPLRQHLEKAFSLRLVRAHQTIRAVSATPDQARLLGVAPRSPLLFIERVSYIQRAQPVEFLRIYYRGDRYTLYNDLHD